MAKNLSDRSEEMTVKPQTEKLKFSINKVQQTSIRRSQLKNGKKVDLDYRLKAKNKRDLIV